LLVLLGEGITKYYTIRGIFGDDAIFRIGKLNIGNMNGEKDGSWISFFCLQSFDTFPQDLQQVERIVLYLVMLLENNAISLLRAIHTDYRIRTDNKLLNWTDFVVKIKIR